MTASFLISASRPADLGISALVLVLPFLGACSVSPDAPSSGDQEVTAAFDGALDPPGSTFVLRRIEGAPPGQEPPIPIELVGSELAVNPREETVSLAVAIRNGGGRSLFPPALVFVSGFEPEEVTILNADAIDSTLTTAAASLSYVFDYTEFLGDDTILRPGETSRSRTWIFSDPGLGAFSFGARATFGLDPTAPLIAGTAFWDANEDGRLDPDEEPVQDGFVRLERPDSSVTFAPVDERGHYRIPVRVPGLYEATLRIRRHIDRLCFTTPHPLEILLPPGPDGLPLSFDHADFGVNPGPCPGSVRRVTMTDRQPNEIEQDPYFLLGAELAGDLLKLEVGFSGCSPHHPFTLYASSQFMESEPVRTWVLLSHDDRGELCDAYWTRRLWFDLDPIRQAYIDAYGAPGVVVLMFRDFRGQITEFRFGP